MIATPVGIRLRRPSRSRMRKSAACWRVAADSARMSSLSSQQQAAALASLSLLFWNASKAAAAKPAACFASSSALTRSSWTVVPL